MAHDKSPLRLVEDPDTVGPLKMLLEGARSDLPDSARLQAFAAKLEGTLASQTNPADIPLDGPAALPELGSAITWGKLALIGLGIVVGGAIVSMIGFAGRGNEPDVAISPAATNSVAALAPSPEQTNEGQPQALPLTPSGAPPRPTSSAATPARADARSLSSVTDAKSRAAEPAPSAPSEATLLLEARSALPRDAARALRITQEHAQQFPAGVLAQEREVIAIEALRRLGQTDLAQKRSAAFDKRYPGSVHRSKINQALENP